VLDTNLTMCKARLLQNTGMFSNVHMFLSFLNVNTR